MSPEIKKKLAKFLEKMEFELDANSHKGNFEEWTNPEEMFLELEWHKAKLMLEMRKNKDSQRVSEYIADCANILFAIGNTWELYNKKEEDEK